MNFPKAKLRGKPGHRRRIAQYGADLPGIVLAISQMLRALVQDHWKVQTRRGAPALACADQDEAGITARPGRKHCPADREAR